jgi:serine/threonine protein kinase
MNSTANSPNSTQEDVPAVGDVIASKYCVEEVVGIGGMGVVLGARHIQLGQRVAIKVLRASEATREEATQRFLREGKAAAGLTSDHVVRIHDVGTLPNGTAYMVMELLRGKDLAAYLADSGALPTTEAVDYVLQTCDAIAEAHAFGIVHRDLKPSNLFLTHRSDGEPLIKVLDFGISKARAGSSDPSFHATLTSTRSVIGSPAYMSPEQIRDAKHVDHRTDIWALGLILYELLTGEQAFIADTLPAVCAAIAADEPPPIRQVRADVPEGLATIVCRCLQKDPLRRFQSVRDLCDALTPFGTHRGDHRRAPVTVPKAGVVAPTIVHRAGASDPPDPRGETIASGERERISVPTSAATLASLTPEDRATTSAQAARSRKVRRGLVVVGLAAVGIALFAGLAWIAPQRRPAASSAVPSAADPMRANARPSATPRALVATAPPEVTPVPATSDSATVAPSASGDATPTSVASEGDATRTAALRPAPTTTFDRPRPSPAHRPPPARENPTPSGTTGAADAATPDIRLQR